jgi:hypothetical protein
MASNGRWIVVVLNYETSHGHRNDLNFVYNTKNQYRHCTYFLLLVDPLKTVTLGTRTKPAARVVRQKNMAMSSKNDSAVCLLNCWWSSPALILGLGPHGKHNPYFSVSRLRMTDCAVCLLNCWWVLASTVCSESHGTNDHILLSDGSGSLRTNLLDRQSVPRYSRTVT